ncbi:MAG: type II toxin-antitoxin system VapC family toxin [Balneolaceae bacterium]
MVITIDTSALLSVLLNEKHKPAIVEVTKGHDLHAPSCLDAEVGNALSAMFKRNLITLEEGERVLSQFGEIPIRRTKLRLKEATKLAHTHNIYAYDAYVLDCALQYRSLLLSLDNKLKEVGKELQLTLLEVSE